MQKPEPNASLIRELKRVLAFAESGALTNAVVVATGPEMFHRTFDVPKGEDMPDMIGEVGLFKLEMEMIVLNNRARQQDARQRLVRPGH